MKRKMKKELKKLKKQAETVTKSKFLTEFKAFALKGNVVDMAVGVIIGSAFSKIVSSLVSYVIMPLVGLLLGGHDFGTLAFSFRETTIYYGLFIQSVIDFLIIAFCIFLFVKLISFARQPQEDKTEEPDKTEVLLEEIRDLLANKKEA